MKRICLLLILMSLIAVNTFAQQKNAFKGNDLAVTWQVVENGHNNKTQSLTALTFTNKGKASLPEKGWKIYFNFARAITNGSETGNVIIDHINGDLFSISPKQGFAGIQPGQQFKTEFVSSDWVVNFTDAPAGFYFVNDGENIGVTMADVTVLPSTEPKQYLRFSGDKIGVITAQDIYNQNKNTQDISESQLTKVFPTPISYKETGGVFILTGDTKIIIDDAFANGFEHTYLKSLINKFVGLPNKKASTATSIELRKKEMPEDAYQLNVTSNTITIAASTTVGIFYGIQSLLTLMPPNVFAGAQKNISIPTVEVADAPRFGYRAFFLDVARNFQPKQEILKVLDLMALYKLNVFHLHFSDDEGWRIEMPSLPELTQIGSKRGFTRDDKTNLQPSFASGIETANAGTGYYSKADFIEILQYATQRHIQVIPEIESPGHARAAVKSMNARYDKYMQQGNKEEAEKYLLYDLNDTSHYSSVQMWNDNVMNVAMPSVYRFMERVVDDLREMYKEARAPLTTIHMGGDEVPAGVWEKAPAYISLLQKDKSIKSTDDLWYYYYGKMNTMLKQKGLFLSGWEEVGTRKTKLDGQNYVVANPDFVNEHFQLDVWNNVIGWGAEDLAYKLANAGYKVVVSFVSNNYFDMAYQKDFNEPGYYWGGFIDVDKPFYLIPFDYLKNTQQDKLGNPVNKSIFIGKQRLTDFGKSNIVGIKGLLWSENNVNSQRMEYMLLPKLLGLAERAWSKDPDWATEKDSIKSDQLYKTAWSNFANIIGKRELPRLDYYAGGFNYRIPSPGITAEDGVIKANVQLPGFAIRYTTDGSEPTIKSALYTQPIQAKGIIKFKTFDARGRGSKVVSCE
ncbi:family 20 glycosylhydrolase [Chitinophagaceae bacterium LWZ2-11]